MVTAASVVVQRRIEWPDTDASGHYHYSTAFRLAEAAEAVLHDRLGIIGETFGRTPRVRVCADFRSVLRFHDVVDVELRVAAVGRTSVTYAFAVRRDDVVAVEGEVATVLLERPEGATAPVPDVWRRLLLEAGPQRPETFA